MAVKAIFVNLPVKDLARTRAFWERLGFSFNPQFSDDTAACLVMSDTVYAMLLTHAKFKEFTGKDIIDSSKGIEVINALGVESREAVDAMVIAAVTAGGSAVRPDADYGFMYQRSFDDLDGHSWEVIWMDPKAVQ